MCVVSPSAFTRSTLIAVSVNDSTVAFGSDARNAVHCDSACGCEYTRRTLSSGMSSEADQTHLDPQHFLADDRQIGVRERVVGVVYRPRRRVLDRQHPVVGRTRPHVLEHAAERRQSQITDLAVPRREELAARDVAERAFGPLEGHRDRPRHFGRAMAAEVGLLRAHREVDNFAKEADNEEVVETETAGPFGQPGNLAGFTERVAKRRVRARLDLGNPRNRLLAPRDQVHELVVEGVQFDDAALRDRRCPWSEILPQGSAAAHGGSGRNRPSDKYK